MQLQKPLRVRVEAPSSPFPPERLAAGVQRLTDAGFVVDPTHAGPRGQHAYLNGSDDDRRRSLEEALASDADLIWLVRGGYGLTRNLPHLTLPPVIRPRVVGFSDATALLCHLAHQRPDGVRHVHGPLISTVALESDASFAHLLLVLEGRPTRIDGLVTVRGPVDVSGPIVAANLCVLTHLIGTASMPKLDGAILALEEIGERPYRIDRMLTQLLSSGALDGVRAVIVGDLIDCDEKPASGRRDPAPAPFDVFVERLAHIPVVRGLPIGHSTPNFAIPFGASAHLVADDRSGRVEINS